MVHRDYYWQNVEQRRAYNRYWQSLHREDIRQRRLRKLAEQEEEKRQRVLCPIEKPSPIQVIHNVVVQF